VRWGRVGAAEARLFSLRAAVDYAVDWLASHRAPAARS
ncbi:AAC(3) family N-acetyltransferase, partial [Nonomuraea basaltis]